MRTTFSKSKFHYHPQYAHTRISRFRKPPQHRPDKDLLVFDKSSQNFIRQEGKPLENPTTLLKKNNATHQIPFHNSAPGHRRAPWLRRLPSWLLRRRGRLLRRCGLHFRNGRRGRGPGCHYSVQFCLWKLPGGLCGRSVRSYTLKRKFCLPDAWMDCHEYRRNEG